MKYPFQATTSISIHASTAKVWDALTNPALIKEYFFGTEAISDWKEGSPLHFKGVWEEKAYEDKGFIIKSEPEKFFHYTYWSAFTGREDTPENYGNVTYTLSHENRLTKLSITQDNIESEEKKQHSESNWNYILNNIKELLEK